MRKIAILLCAVLCTAGAALAQDPSNTSNFAPDGLVVNPGVIEGGGCPCVSGSPEGEGNCGIPTDTVNGGCNSAPVVTSPIVPNAPVCGTAEWNGQLRDTDWYEYTVTETSTFTWRAEAEFPAAMFIVDTLCPAPTILGSDTTTGCGDVGEITMELAPGTYRFFIAPDFSGPTFACGAEYSATLVGDANILAIPTLSTIGLALIALALGAFAIHRLRRRGA